MITLFPVPRPAGATSNRRTNGKDASVENLAMNTVELIGPAYEPAANTAPDWRGGVIEADASANARAAAARGFLIQLVVREIQIADRSAAWLRAAAEQLADVGPGIGDALEVLADRTRRLRAELVVLVHRLVARRNRLAPDRRIDVIAVLAQPLSPAMTELFEVHEANLASGAAWRELASLCAVERMISATIPLAIDISRSDDGDLVEAASLFRAREERADVLAKLLAELVVADPERAASIPAAEEAALASFSRVLAECSEIGRELDSRRRGFVRY